MGLCTAMALASKNSRTLLVEQHFAPGQESSKRPIGGIRATHSNAAKIMSCLRSLEVFRSWKDIHGTDIGYLEGGYLFVLYTQNDKKVMEGLLPFQKRFGLNIDFVSPARVAELTPGIARESLLGGIFSPEDGHCSPLLANAAFYAECKRLGVAFSLGKRAAKILKEENRAVGVELVDGTIFHSPIVVETTGATTVSPTLMLNSQLTPLPLFPDCHEAGITEPAARLFDAMVVDIRPRPGSKNFYFYQNKEGKIVFCLTPDPMIVGDNTENTSKFLEMISRRMLELFPRLRNLRVRRLWRGLYPMTADGQPLVGWNRELEGLYHANGMCGQGFMLGPGVGEHVARSVLAGSKYSPSKESAVREEKMDAFILEEFSPYRKAGAMEALK